MTQKEHEMEEQIKMWNIVAMVVFVALAVLAFRCLEARSAIVWLSFGEVLLLSLATMRIIRLVAYDNITLFLREAFTDVKKVRFVEGGEDSYERVPSENSFKRTVSKLLNCPWCIGVWIALGVVYVYLVYPESYIFFVVLAIAGIASLLQMLANLLGWKAEYKKIATQKLSQE
jgi:Protein of unknown function (DUF1360)